jgi:hypothetical protein
MKVNFLIMTAVWAFTSMSYYVINFYLKYLEGSIFVNVYVSAVAEVSSVLLAGFFCLTFGLQKALLISYIIGFIGAVMIIFFEEILVDFVPVFVLFAKFGVGSAFGLIYVANFIFPTKYASQTLGYCNTIARLFTILSPMIAE